MKSGSCLINENVCCTVFPQRRQLCHVPSKSNWVKRSCLLVYGGPMLALLIISSWDLTQQLSKKKTWEMMMDRLDGKQPTVTGKKMQAPTRDAVKIPLKHYIDSHQKNFYSEASINFDWNGKSASTIHKQSIEDLLGAGLPYQEKFRTKFAMVAQCGYGTMMVINWIFIPPPQDWLRVTNRFADQMARYPLTRPSTFGARHAGRWCAIG